MTPTLHLRHHTNNRWRFVLSFSPELDWSQLHRDLLNAFPERTWTVRIKQRIGSIVVSRLASAPRLSHDSLAVVYGRVAQQLNLQGLSLPETPLVSAEIMGEVTKGWKTAVYSALEGLANAVSVSLSISTLLLSFSVFIIGFVGLFIPFSPGIWLLILATALFDFALSLRRPFVV